MLSTLRALFSKPAAQGARPSFFDAYNSTAANILVSTQLIGSKFAVTVKCESCAKRRDAAAFIFNAADANLAIAVGFAMAEYGKHCGRFHRDQ